jgi:hypothetical protein
MNPEYFPSSYLSPVPTVLLESGDVNEATFPRSTITGTLENFRALLCVLLLSKKNRVSQDVYRALNLNIASEATQSTDKATAPKRISAFLRLCALYIPCEVDDYEDVVRTLDSEVDPDLRKAKLILEMIQDQNLPVIVKAQNETVSALLQVLYFLQREHVQFLIGDYKTRILDAHGHDAFTAKVKAKKLGRDGLPRSIHDVKPFIPTPGQTVDMSQSDDEEAGGSDDEERVSAFDGRIDAS